MRGSYDNQWKNAFDGKSIVPSDAVWENISSSMDSGYGKRNWVTILLIAATVSIAFAFPLTIGNSSFEARPDNFELSDSAQPSQNIESDFEIPAKSESPLVVEDSKTEDLQNMAIMQQSNIFTMLEDDQLASQPVIEIASADAKGLSINDAAALVGYELDAGYDIIPFFVPLSQGSERGVLAMASLGSGNRSVSDGFNNMDMLGASADFESNISNTKQGDIRSEEGGTTFSIGLGAEIPLGKKWSIISGIGYMMQRAPGTSNIVYDDNGTYVPLGAYSSVEPGTIFLSESYSYTAVNRFVNIPLVVKYPIIDRKFKLRLGAGVSNDFMIQNTITTQEYAEAKNSVGDTNYAPYGITGVLNLDLRFKLADNYALALETGLRKGFTSVNSSGNRYPTSFNVGIMLFYHFR